MGLRVHRVRGVEVVDGRVYLNTMEASISGPTSKGHKPKKLGGACYFQPTKILGAQAEGL